MIVTCQGCGDTRYRGDDFPKGDPEHCDRCPPWRCEDCGEMCAAPPNLCSCWVQFEGMPLADIKGYLAQADLSVDQKGGAR